MNGWVALMVAAVAISLIFLIGWIWARKINNYSLVDAVWAFGIGLISASWLVAGGLTIKTSVAAGLVLLWSMRLGWHLQRRIRKVYPEEDSRYVKLRELWKDRECVAFFLFFQSQAVSVILLALPFLLVALDSADTWSVWETIGLIAVVIGVAGEAIADEQIARFKTRNQGSGGVCREGLWGYSRHPNYFFESVIWLGFYLYACGSEWGWGTVHAPAIIIYLLLRVTGIPPTEAAAVQRKGDAYRHYQRTVSAFIPWFPKTKY